MSATARPRTASSSGWWGSLWRPWPVVVLAGLVRLALVCWAEYQDAFLPVNYTDIDYAVFTDAARFVAAGGSPYQRSTFRYSPLLAYLMLPNIWLHPAWGKVLFSACDLFVAGLISYLLCRTCTMSPRLHAAALAVWLFNPYTATISTRGSCDVLSILLLLSLLACLLHGRPLASGMLYGVAVHFRIYPVIYGPAIALFLARRSWILQEREAGRPGGRQTGSVLRYEEQPSHVPAAGSTTAVMPTMSAEGEATTLDQGRVGMPARRRTAPWLRAASSLRPSAAFAVAAASTFLLLGAAFYRLYGSEFLQEAFVHHLTRKDPRHNFSPYYYPVYLSYGVRSSSVGVSGVPQDWKKRVIQSEVLPRPPHVISSPLGTASGAHSSAADNHVDTGVESPPHWLLRARLAVQLCLPVLEPWRVALLPQAAVLLAVAVRYHEDLPTAWLLQTWSFVALNKVITAQYFVWFLSLLPLTLPALVAQRTVSARAMGAASLFWVVAQLHWLGWAYALEMQVGRGGPGLWDIYKICSRPGLSVHVGVWAAGLGFLAANTAAVALLLRALQPRLHGATTFMDASLKLCQPRPAHAIALASKKHN
ncbi:GPI mannosyltransferase 1, partial [Tetrabaena socialis]